MITNNNNQIKTKFHFAGDGKIPPMTIDADNIDEATKIYREKFLNKIEPIVETVSTEKAIETSSEEKESSEDELQDEEII